MWRCRRTSVSWAVLVTRNSRGQSCSPDPESEYDVPKSNKITRSFAEPVKTPETRFSFVSRSNEKRSIYMLSAFCVTD